MPGPPESVFIAGVRAAILDGGSQRRTSVRREGLLGRSLLGLQKGQLTGLWGVCPEAAERKWDDAGSSRGPVPWAGDASNVTASRSLSRRGEEEERTRRRRRRDGRSPGRPGSLRWAPRLGGGCGGRPAAGPGGRARSGCRAEGPGQAAVTPGGAGRAGGRGPRGRVSWPASLAPTSLLRFPWAGGDVPAPPRCPVRIPPILAAGDSARSCLVSLLSLGWAQGAGGGPRLAPPPWVPDPSDTFSGADARSRGREDEMGQCPATKASAPRPGLLGSAGFANERFGPLPPGPGLGVPRLGAPGLPFVGRESRPGRLSPAAAPGLCRARRRSDPGSLGTGRGGAAAFIHCSRSRAWVRLWDC